MQDTPGQWWCIDSSVLNSPAVGMLPAREAMRKFFAALDGEENEWSPFIRGPYVRPPAHEWRALRAAVFARDDYTCQYCGDRGGRLECDHIVPVARGGHSGMDNLTTACRPCNRAKRSKTPEEWAAR